MRTINRVPFTVNEPDVEYKFFNHYNWKGLNTNKNYFDIDQETFEDCQDVYMDENGVLKSRPTLKVMTSEGLADIQDMWTFGNIRVYKTGNKLVIVDNGNYEVPDVDDDVKLIMFDNKLLIFTPTSMRYYFNGTISSMEDLVYIPETTIYSNGIRTKERESKNILTKSETTTYLYENVDKINNVNINDRVVDITINTDTYTNIKFVTGLENVLFSKKYKLTDDNYSPLDYLGEGIEGIPMISVEEYNGQSITLLSSIDGNIHRLYYSVDNLLFKELPDPGEIYNLPYLAKHEALAVVIKEDGLYCISLLEGNENLYYPKWTKFYEFTSNIPKFNAQNETNKTCSLVINDITNFLFTYYDYVNKWTVVNYMINNVSGDYYIFDSDIKYGSEYLADMLNRPWALQFVSNNSYDFIFIVGKFITKVTHTNSNREYYNTVNFTLALSPTMRRDLFTANVTFSGTSLGASHDTSDYIAANYSKLYYKNNCISIPELDTITLTDGSVNYNVSYKTIADYLLYERNNEVRGIYNLYNHTYYPDEYNSDKLYRETTTKSLATYSTDEYQFVVGTGKSLLSNLKYYIETDYDSNNQITNKFYYTVNLNTEIYPVHSDTYITATSLKTSENKYILHTDLSNDTVIIKDITKDSLNDVHFSNLVFLNQLYTSIGNSLYISTTKYDSDGNAMLYFTEDNKHTFNNTINNLHPISTSQVAVFFDNEIWYTDIESINETYVYTINKSKLSVGCKAKSDIVTTFDGKYVIFPSQRGLVAMGYQDFVASTEQTLTYLSDTILDRFNKFSKEYTKLHLYKHWLYCYNNNAVYLFDFRNSSWWYFNIKNIDKIVTNDDELLILAAGHLHEFITDAEEYYDDYYDPTYKAIHQKDVEWFVLSQKLHLGTLNYTKHIINITLNALDSTINGPMSMRLKVTNYRVNAIESENETLQYEIDVLRTYVKRLNYFKVNQFQYKLSYDDVESMPIPLSLDNITIKYNVTRQVR